MHIVTMSSLTRRWYVVFERGAREYYSLNFTFCVRFNYVTQITRISLTHTARKSLENQRSNANDENLIRARTQVHKGSRRILEAMATICSQKLATMTIGLRLKLKHRNYFRTIRIQKHVRSILALNEWRKQKAWYAGMKTASDRALSVWQMKEGRQFFFNCTRGHVAATEFFETVQSRVWIRTQIRATIVIQSFVRKCLRASYVARRVGSTVHIQQAFRFRRLWKRFEAREGAVAVVE